MENQLSFFNAQFLYQGDNEQLHVQLDISSEDKILGFGFKTSNDKFLPELIKFKNNFTGKRIDEISFDNLGTLSIPALTFWMAIQDYDQSLHQKFESYGGNPDQLVCRCMRVDKEMLQKSIDTFEADKKKITESLMVSQICGGCRPLVEKLLAESSWRKDYFADIPNHRWVDNIHAALSRSHLGTKNLPDMTCEVIRYQSNKVKLRVGGDRGGLNRFELTEKIQVFLRDRIHPEITVSVVL